MADDVSIRVRLLDRLRFQRDAAAAEESVEDIGDEAKRTSALLSTMGKVGSGVGRAMGRGLKMAAGAGVVALASIATAAVNYASDLGESVAKADVIFGKHARGIQTWSKGMAKDFGVARGEALETASGFMAMFKSAGVVSGEGTRMSKVITELGADMASMHNADPSEMLDKLRSGLAGESEPLRRYGVFLSEAAVQTEAVRAGIAKHGEELTDAQKVQARYNIILAQTKDAHGDVARTYNSLPNALRRFKAMAKDALAEVGVKLLPHVSKALSGLAEAFGPAMDELGPVLVVLAKLLGETIAPVVESAAPLLTMFGKILVMVARELQPIVKVLLGALSQAFKALLPGLKPVLKALGDGLLTIIMELAPVIPDVAVALSDMAIAMVPLVPVLAKLITLLVKIGGVFLRDIAEGISSLAGTITPVVEAIVQGIEWMVNKVIDGINWAMQQADKIPGFKAPAEIAHVDLSSDAFVPVTSGGQASGTSGQTGQRRAMGGPTTAFEPYWVGEHGPELHVPRASGRIIPHHEVERGTGGDGAGLSVGEGVTWYGDLIVQGAGDPEAVAEAVIRRIQDKAARR